MQKTKTKREWCVIPLTESMTQIWIVYAIVVAIWCQANQISPIFSRAFGASAILWCGRTSRSDSDNIMSSNVKSYVGGDRIKSFYYIELNRIFLHFVESILRTLISTNDDDDAKNHCEILYHKCKLMLCDAWVESALIGNRNINNDCKHSQR